MIDFMPEVTEVTRQLASDILRTHSVSLDPAAVVEALVFVTMATKASACQSFAATDPTEFADKRL